MSRVEFAHRALTDLNSIWDYIAADNPQAANNLIRQ